MDSTAIIFRLLEGRVLELERRLFQLGQLPEELKRFWAMRLCRDCFRCMKESTEICEQMAEVFQRDVDARYEETLDVVDISNKKGLGWPFGIEDKREKRQKNFSHYQQVLCLAKHCADYDGRIQGEIQVINGRIRTTLDTLEHSYGIDTKRFGR
jgi:hypothetical protein